MCGHWRDDTRALLVQASASLSTAARTAARTPLGGRSLPCLGCRAWAAVPGVPCLGYRAWGAVPGLPCLGCRAWGAVPGVPCLGCLAAGSSGWGQLLVAIYSCRYKTVAIHPQPPPLEQRQHHHSRRGTISRSPSNSRRRRVWCWRIWRSPAEVCLPRRRFCCCIARRARSFNP